MRRVGFRIARSLTSVAVLLFFLLVFYWLFAAFLPDQKPNRSGLYQNNEAAMIPGMIAAFASWIATRSLVSRIFPEPND